MSSSALWTAFEERTAGLGRLPAVVTPERTVSFAELWQEADRLATALVRAGVRERTTVGLSHPGSHRFVAALLALCKLDLSIALLSPQYGVAELAPIVSGAGVGCIVAESGAARRITAALPIARDTEADGLHVLFMETVPNEHQAAVLKFSSGSTSQPKGIAVDGRSVLTEAENVRATLGLGAGDRIFADVPLSHSYGFDCAVLPTLYAGTTLVLDDGISARSRLSALEDADVFLGTPAHYRTFLSVALAAPPDFSRVRWPLSCTAPLGVEVVRAFAERFGLWICQHYGSSETGAVTNHLPDHVAERPASVGYPLVGVGVSIVDAAGAPLPEGVEGEVVVESGALASGYVLGAPSGASPFREGRFWTGDVGVVDGAGFLTLRGRRDTMINVGGLKVSPAEVTAVLEQHPHVVEAAVLGVRDRLGEEVTYGVVALDGPADEAALIAFCRERLAPHKVPRRIEIRDALPRSASGKIRIGQEDIAL